MEHSGLRETQHGTGKAHVGYSSLKHAIERGLLAGDTDKWLGASP